MTPIGYLRETAATSERDIETIAAQLLETGPSESDKPLLDSICNQANWSYRTCVAELRVRARRVLKERVDEFEERLRAEDHMGHMTLDQITAQAREVADLICNRSEGWPVGCIGI